MNFSVEWVPTSVNELATLWLNGTPEVRQAINRATEEIDRILRADPEDAGESRPDGMRILHAPPLGVNYLVSPMDRKVQVLRVWRYDKRKSR